VPTGKSKVIQALENTSVQVEVTQLQKQVQQLQADLTHSQHVLQRIEQLLKIQSLQAIKAYKKEHNIQTHQWPENFKLEPIRMKRYLPNTEDVFDEHVDVTNYASARRFLVFFIYLSDDFEGGETNFSQFKIKVKPKQGSLLMFPPLWNWLHQAQPVKRNAPKYIVGSFMHYV